MPSGLQEDSNEPTPQRLSELPPSFPFLPSSSPVTLSMMRFALPKPRGVISAAATVTYVSRSVVRSGSRRSRRIVILRDDFGDLSTLYLDVDGHR